MSSRKTHVADRHMADRTPCGRSTTEGRIALTAPGAEPTCAWCSAYVRGTWGAAGIVTPNSEPLR
jgi:hypothetical protein